MPKIIMYRRFDQKSPSFHSEIMEPVWLDIGRHNFTEEGRRSLVKTSVTCSTRLRKYHKWLGAVGVTACSITACT